MSVKYAKLIKKYGFWGLAILLSMLMVGTSMYFAVNIPRLDDCDQVLGFLLNFQEAEGLIEKIRLVFSERNEHRSTFLHLAALIDFSIFGKVDFRHFIFLINIIYLTIVFVIWKISKKLEISSNYFIPVLFFLLVPNYSFLNWTSAGVVYGSCVLFSLSAFYILNKSSWSTFAWAGFFAILSLINFAGGILAFLCALPFFITKHSKKALALWLALMFTSVAIYTIGFNPSIKTNPFFDSIRSPFTIIINTLVFYGIPFRSLFSQTLSWHFAVGPILLLVFMIVLIKYWPRIKSQPLLLSGLLWGLGIALGIAFLRSGHGLGSSTATRYVLFQSILPIFIYLTFVYLKKVTKNNLSWIIGISCILFLFRFENQLEDFNKNYNALVHGLYNYNITRNENLLSVKNSRQAVEYFKQTKHRGIYDYQDHLVVPKTVSKIKTWSHPQEMRFVRREMSENTDYFILSGWAFPKFNTSDNLKILLSLQSGTQRIFLETGPLVSKEVIVQQADNGFVAVIDKSRKDIPSGEYSVSIILSDRFKGIVARHPLSKTLVF